MAWTKMVALAEFASRPRRQDFAADEVASAFNLTWLSAAKEIEYARHFQSHQHRVNQHPAYEGGACAGAVRSDPGLIRAG
jgi:hypothetical protein